MALYDDLSLQQVTGPTLRPGGLAITRDCLADCVWRRGDLVADVGCGLGETAAMLQQRDGLICVGIDLSADLLHQARRRHPQLAIICADAGALPLPENCLTVLCCECVLSLLKCPEQALRAFHRVLKPGGRLVLTDIYRRNPTAGDDLPDAGCLCRAVTAATARHRLTVAGFQIITWQDRSDALKRLAADIVWRHGSLERFWQSIGINGSGAARLAELQPGYYCAIACKGSAPNG